MIFAVTGDKHDGIASLEAVKKLNGNLDFT